MNNPNIKGFSILELVISFIIITFVIYGFSVILGKTSMLESYKKNYYYLNFEVNQIKDNIYKVFENCHNKELVFTGYHEITSKDNFYSKNNHYYDSMVFSCDNKYIILGIANKYGTGLINPILKNEDIGLFSIYENSLSNRVYTNTNVNILRFQFSQAKIGEKYIIRGDLYYDNKIEKSENGNDIQDNNYISGSTFFLFNE